MYQLVHKKLSVRGGKKARKNILFLFFRTVKLTVASQYFFSDIFRCYRSFKIKKKEIRLSSEQVSFAATQVDERKAFNECEIWSCSFQLKTIVLK